MNVNTADSTGKENTKNQMGNRVREGGREEGGADLKPLGRREPADYA